jgi:ATPase subunit of ABC transporter with duplicated ATPase domains
MEDPVDNSLISNSKPSTESWALVRTTINPATSGAPSTTEKEREEIERNIRKYSRAVYSRLLQWMEAGKVKANSTTRVEINIKRKQLLERAREKARKKREREYFPIKQEEESQELVQDVKKLVGFKISLGITPEEGRAHFHTVALGNCNFVIPFNSKTQQNSTNNKTRVSLPVMLIFGARADKASLKAPTTVHLTAKHNFVALTHWQGARLSSHSR